MEYNKNVGEDIDRILEFDFDLDFDETDLVDPADLINDLGLDSLSMTELIMRIEAVFGLEIPKEVYEIKTLGELKVAVTTLQTKEQAAGVIT